MKQKKKDSLSKSKRLCDFTGRTIQVRGSNPLAKMHPSQSRHRTSERDPRWHLRIPHRHQTSRSQGIQAGFLLAICAERRIKSGQNLRSLPKAEPKIKQTFGTLATDSPRLAPLAVGNGPCRPSSHSTRKLQIRSGGR